MGTTALSKVRILPWSNKQVKTVKSENIGVSHTKIAYNRFLRLSFVRGLSAVMNVGSQSQTLIFVDLRETEPILAETTRVFAKAGRSRRISK